MVRKGGEGSVSSNGVLKGGWGVNNSPYVLTKFSQNVKSAFYIRSSYAYVHVNNKTRLGMVYSS